VVPDLTTGALLFVAGLVVSSFGKGLGLLRGADDRYVPRREHELEAQKTSQRFESLQATQASLMKLHEEERAARHALGNQLQKDLVPRLVRVEERQQTTLDKLDEVKALVEKLG
jgi:hypothetical protein